MEEYLNGLESDFFALLSKTNLIYQTCPISNMAQPCGFTANQYSNDIFQKAYLLKYVQAYGLDYKNLYTKLKSASPDLNQRKCLKILSVGCGCGIDLASAQSVFNDIEVTYTGVDVIDWNDRIYVGEDGVQYHNYGIDNIDDSLISSADILIFPRSVTDISEESLNEFARRLASLNKNKFYILWAHVHSNSAVNSQLENGVVRINAMIKVIEKAGLTLEAVEDSIPSVSESIEYRDYDVKDACRNEGCQCQSCNFIALKHINDKGYHHIVRKVTSE